MGEVRRLDQLGHAGDFTSQPSRIGFGPEAQLRFQIRFELGFAQPTFGRMTIQFVGRPQFHLGRLSRHKLGCHPVQAPGPFIEFDAARTEPGFQYSETLFLTPEVLRPSAFQNATPPRRERSRSVTGFGQFPRGNRPNSFGIFVAKSGMLDGNRLDTGSRDFDAVEFGPEELDFAPAHPAPRLGRGRKGGFPFLRRRAPRSETFIEFVRIRLNTGFRGHQRELPAFQFEAQFHERMILVPAATLRREESALAVVECLLAAADAQGDGVEFVGRLRFGIPPEIADADERMNLFREDGPLVGELVRLSRKFGAGREQPALFARQLDEEAIDERSFPANHRLHRERHRELRRRSAAVEQLLPLRFQLLDRLPQTGGPSFETRDFGEELRLAGFERLAIRLEERVLLPEHFGAEFERIALPREPIFGLLAIRQASALPLREQFPCGLQSLPIRRQPFGAAIEFLFPSTVEFAEPFLGRIALGAGFSARFALARPADADAVETFFVQRADSLFLGRNGLLSGLQFAFALLDELGPLGELRGRVLPFEPELLARIAELPHQILEVRRFVRRLRDPFFTVHRHAPVRPHFRGVMPTIEIPASAEFDRGMCAVEGTAVGDHNVGIDPRRSGMSAFEDVQRYDDVELAAEFERLFPQGWAGIDVMRELAPEGWATSPLCGIYHPTAVQVYEETVQMRRNLENLPLTRRRDAPPPAPEPTLAEIAAGHVDSPVEPERELQELVGRCLWDIFCDNHDVIAEDGRRLDLGSMRSGGGFLAEVLNKQDGPKPEARPEMPEELMKMMRGDAAQDEKTSAFMVEMIEEMVGDGGYTYLDFYMGTSMMSGRADLVPVYAMIFRRLRARGSDWRYSFPRIYAVDMRPLKKQLDEQAKDDEPEWSGYDPSAALAEEREETQKDEEIEKLRSSLDMGFREAVEASRDRPPPATVRAYEAVNGSFPAGWPPEA